MATHVCLCVRTLGRPEGGGRLWAYLHWALGLLALGCRVSWLEELDPASTAAERGRVGTLRAALRAYGLADGLALCCAAPEAPARAESLGCRPLEEAAAADLLLNFRPDLSAEVVCCFRRTALLDLDPGAFQLGLASGDLTVPRHDAYFTVGETAGKMPADGPGWIHTPPCVALDRWPVFPAPPGGAFTAVCEWTEDERTGFLPFRDLPKRAVPRLELALEPEGETKVDVEFLHGRGWSVRNAPEVASDPASFQRFVRESRGEFRWARPDWACLGVARLGEHTPCYLASGRPAIVQHTGPSRYLPDAEGLFRFRDPDDAACCLAAAAVDPARHGRLARALAEEHFDARKVLKRLLEVALF